MTVYSKVIYIHSCINYQFVCEWLMFLLYDPFVRGRNAMIVHVRGDPNAILMPRSLMSQWCIKTVTSGKSRPLLQKERIPDFTVCVTVGHFAYKLYSGVLRRMFELNIETQREKLRWDSKKSVFVFFLNISEGSNQATSHERDMVHAWRWEMHPHF